MTREIEVVSEEPRCNVTRAGLDTSFERIGNKFSFEVNLPISSACRYAGLTDHRATTLYHFFTYFLTLLSSAVDQSAVKYSVDHFSNRDDPSMTVFINISLYGTLV